MPILTYRRLCGHMTQIFKILNRECGYDHKVPAGFMKLSKTSFTRGHSLKLEQRSLRARLDIRKYSFSHRVVTPGNSVPEYVINAFTLDTLKNWLDS